MMRGGTNQVKARVGSLGNRTGVTSRTALVLFFCFFLREAEDLKRM